MKIRLTLGNVIGAVMTAAGFIAAHDQIIQTITSTVGGKLAALGTIVLVIAKGIISGNTDKVPAEQKLIDTSKLVIQKTLVK